MYTMGRGSTSMMYWKELGEPARGKHTATELVLLSGFLKQSSYAIEQRINSASLN